LLHLSALLHKILPVKNLPGTKTVTANVSCGGCFLIKFDPWNVGDKGWLILPDLKDTAPIPVEVCFVRSWGVHASLPGMGVRFVELSDAQRVELSSLVGCAMRSTSCKD
jgi:Tfp pilus assembly protein PilZ